MLGGTLRTRAGRGVEGRGLESGCQELPHPGSGQPPAYTAPLYKLEKGTPAPTLHISLDKIKLPFCRSKTVDGSTYYFHLLGIVINDPIIK